MKNYDKDKKIIALLQDYKNLKKANSMLTPTKIKEKTMDTLFSKEQILSRKEFEALLNERDAISEQYKSEKKEATSREEQIKTVIGNIVEEDVKDNEKERELIFSNIGSVRCTFEKKYINTMTPEEKMVLIQECIDNGEIDMLDIPEENIIAISERCFQTTGKQLPGIAVMKEIETKIRISGD